MKRLTKGLLREVNHESELLTPKYLRSTGISKLVGPNYIYFTNGSLVKVYFDGYPEEESMYLSGLVFPLRRPYLRLPGLKRIREDLIRIRETL